MPFRLFLMLLSLLPFMAGESEDDSDDQNDDANDRRDPDRDDDQGLKAAGREALKRERDARKTAEKNARDAAKELADLKAAKAKADEDKQAEQGEWKDLAEKRDADLTRAATDLESATTELETLRTYVSGDVAAITKSVKDAKDSPAAKALLDFYPGDDASALELLAWAQKAKPRLTELTSTKEPYRGNGPNPKPGAGETKIDENAAMTQARRTVRI